MHEAELSGRFRLPILLATLLVVPVIVLETTARDDALRTSAAALNWLIWLVFVAELVALFVVARERRGFARRYPLELAIVVITVPFLPASLQAARLFRLARLLRLLLVVRLASRLFSPAGLRFAAFIAGVAVLAGGAAFEAAERSQQPTPTLWDGVWWATTTLTTVGYGDFAPETTLGRVVGIALMAIGIGFVAILTGAIARRFIESVHTAPSSGEDDASVAEELRALGERLAALEHRMREREARQHVP